MKWGGVSDHVNAFAFYKSSFINCGVLHDLVAFVQFKKREKYPWRSVNFSKVAG